LAKTKYTNKSGEPLAAWPRSPVSTFPFTSSRALTGWAVCPYPLVCPSVVVVGFAAVVALQAAVAQDAQLAVPPA
jgi:hypothetical protein